MDSILYITCEISSEHFYCILHGIGSIYCSLNHFQYNSSFCCASCSVMENFFGIMKQEMYYGNTFHSFDELKEAIEKYIKYYNEKRIKEKLGWMSPVQYRLSIEIA